MCGSGRSAFPFHTQVDLDGARAEPGAAPIQEKAWLWDLGPSGHGSVGVPQVILPTRGDGEQCMTGALEGMLERKPKKVVAVAFANRMARRIRVLARRKETYRVRPAA